MLLAIDIGNTNINFGIFQGRRLFKEFLMPTNGYTLNRLKKYLKGFDINASIMCSVVPDCTKRLEKDLRQKFHFRVHIVGKSMIVPVRNLYHKPKEVGQDRLVNAYAGIKLYGSPLVIIDFGTAITFDLISKNKDYLGGLIVPGLEISLDALAERTALLPRIKLRKPKELIATDTKNSILSGIVYGFSALADELSRRLRLKLGKNAKVIGTGGNIKLIKEFSRKITKIDKDLTLKGLNFIYNYYNS